MSKNQQLIAPRTDRTAVLAELKRAFQTPSVAVPEASLQLLYNAARSPGVTVGVEADAVYAQSEATPPEPLGALLFVHRIQLREKRAGGREGAKQGFDFWSKAQMRDGPGPFARVGHEIKRRW